MPTLMLELASASLPNPLRCLACLGARSPLHMRLRHCPHHSRHIFSLACNPYTPAAPSCYTSDSALTPLCLILSAAYHPYACVVPSQHASDAAYHPWAHGVPF
ncbi:hypothetical protein O181_060179 [Austropuccinia psidii MF-1]|uniref:Uncharacterized protein n=1 Tax=Austropuccinia psidii MF-1 TaxID=1389203 RepID=A0A9Q3HZC9_9BASI|nr:hypothetical protein [Austropuccinia psidii MF-1]